MSPRGFSESIGRRLRNWRNDQIVKRKGAIAPSAFGRGNGRLRRRARSGIVGFCTGGSVSGFGDQEFYPTKEEKGARLGYALISNHTFLDGNKRIGLYVMLSFLEMNGIRIRCTDEELVYVGLSIADGKMGYEDLYYWVIEHEE